MPDFPRAATGRRAPFAPLLLGLLLLVALLAGCAPGGTADPLLAARVNGRSIALSQYQQLLAVFRASAERNLNPNDWRPASQRQALVDTERQTMDYLINNELMHEQLRQQRLSVSASDVAAAEKQLASVVESLRSQYAQSPDPSLKRLLDALTPDMVRLLSEQQAVQAVLVAKAKLPALQLRAIAVKTYQEAEDLKGKVLNGADFATLAKTYSLDKASGAQGGKIGTIYIGQITNDFDQRVFAPNARPDKYQVMNLDGGYWLFEVTDIGPKPASALTNPQVQQTALDRWLSVVVRAQASVQEYVAIA